MNLERRIPELRRENCSDMYGDVGDIARSIGATLCAAFVAPRVPHLNATRVQYDSITTNMHLGCGKCNTVTAAGARRYFVDHANGPSYEFGLPDMEIIIFVLRLGEKLSRRGLSRTCSIACSPHPVYRSQLFTTGFP